MIGTFGDVVFEVSDQHVRTFQDFTRNTQARWAEHNIIGDYPKPEFIGPGRDSITFKMRFDVSHGMNPRDEMTKLLVMCKNGQAETLIIGELPMGAFKWVIDSVSQVWKHTDNQGNVLVGTVDVTLKEYI
ncbi:phage tail protein [Chengkuizengella axinellae]|uniref:Phage tail protein n=1 Tax=Chengkuizengella axinellae TaxID=3064388 RepID=A0ABT9J698_9BACL|nr:phage tail protein [Chengkuizengella sp. 2205SS18-9]MDP5277137.1 phage tail protein [Chengkuizengella sp. 2205SS18-9]